MIAFDDMTMPQPQPVDPGQLPDIGQMDIPAPEATGTVGDSNDAGNLDDLVFVLKLYAPVFTNDTKKAMVQEIGAYAAALAARLLGLPHGRIDTYVQNVPLSN